jgi:hypothetical protein
MKLFSYRSPFDVGTPYHRTAYFDVVRRQDRTAIIGLHLIVRLCRRIWEWSYCYRESNLENLLNDAFCKGSCSRNREIEELRDNYDRGYRKGREEIEAYYRRLVIQIQQDRELTLEELFATTEEKRKLRERDT